jgi:hypothetical protein
VSGAYLYTSSIIFLSGAQVDELPRRQAKRGRTGLDALTTLDRRDTSARDDASPRGTRPRSRASAG